MKYMLMMFGDGEAMQDSASPEWVRDMIAFMHTFNAELTASGELIGAYGLAYPSTAKLVSLEGDQVVVTDGPFAEAKESLAGFWLLEVAGEPRAIELAGRIVEWARRVELREVPDGPPEQ